jgi:hypothetical protein
MTGRAFTNLVPRARVPFGQYRETIERNAGSERGLWVRDWAFTWLHTHFLLRSNILYTQHSTHRLWMQKYIICKLKYQFAANIHKIITSKPLTPLDIIYIPERISSQLPAW